MQAPSHVRRTRLAVLAAALVLACGLIALFAALWPELTASRSFNLPSPASSATPKHPPHAGPVGAPGAHTMAASSAGDP